MTQGRSLWIVFAISVAVIVTTILSRRYTLVIVLLVLGAAGLLLALWLGGDRTIPCDAKRGLDTVFFDLSHVDGPEGGGGCIVPSAGAWVAAVAAFLAPTVVWLATHLVMRSRAAR